MLSKALEKLVKATLLRSTDRVEEIIKAEDIEHIRDLLLIVTESGSTCAGAGVVSSFNYCKSGDSCSNCLSFLFKKRKTSPAVEIIRKYVAER
ncbi:MAG: hypothetical protein Q7J85_12530 [Bacillota bacterium]|nr:hypothetical protein [Bacillota bacterium]